MRIDAHHHLWHYSQEEFGWIEDSMAVLRRDFLLDDLRKELATANVDGTVAVQAPQTVQETDWLLSLAEEPASPILGVVGWLPLTDASLPQLLERYSQQPKLKGIRHIVQAEADGFLDQPAFLKGVSMLGQHGLTYDILIRASQLEEATRFVDALPNQTFVLDHIAKPDIRNNDTAEWATHLHELARRPNVHCKLSGMVTEADFHAWTPAQLRPYFDVVLEAFGPRRLMVGTDWPVMTVACNYQRWWEIVAEWIAPLSPEEREAIEGGNAARVYRLSV